MPSIIFHTEETAMPTYDFRCEKCNGKFTLILSILEYEKAKVRCPKCKSTKVKQEITPFQVKTSKKS
jgi:putative FmdB family regulatory protein